MKKLFLLFTLIMSVALFSCSDDDDKQNPVENPKDYLYGNWKLMTLKEGSSYIDWPYEATTIYFSREGVYTTQGYFGNDMGTYKLSGGNIYLYDDGELVATLKVVLLTSTNCELIVPGMEDDEMLQIRCTKIISES